MNRTENSVPRFPRLGVIVSRAVGEGCGVAVGGVVAVGTGVLVLVAVGVGTGVLVWVAVGKGVLVGVAVFVGVAVGGRGVGVAVSVGALVGKLRANAVAALTTCRLHSSLDRPKAARSQVLVTGLYAQPLPMPKGLAHPARRKISKPATPKFTARRMCCQPERVRASYIR